MQPVPERVPWWIFGSDPFHFFDSAVATAGFGGEQRQSRFDGVMAWWPAAMLSARAGTGRREHLSPHPAAGGARGDPTAKFTTVFTTRFHAQAQQKQKSISKSITIFTQVFTTLCWTTSTPRFSNIHHSLHHRIHSRRYSPRGDDQCDRGGYPC